MSNQLKKGKTPIEEYEARQKVLTDALENINKVSKELAMTRPAFRKELQEKLDKMTFNYNSLIEKQSKNKTRPLKVEGKQSEEEKIKLLELIDSV